VVVVGVVVGGGVVAGVGVGRAVVAGVAVGGVVAVVVGVGMTPNPRAALQCDISPELFKRFTALRKRLGMGNRGLLERVLLEALPRWEQVIYPGDEDER